jgi:Gryzun, putative Golgi trafficking
VGKMLALEIWIKNLSYMLEDLSVLVKENDSFVFTGVKRASFKVRPAEDYVLRYNLLPICAGQVRFPKFIVKSKRYGNDVVDPKQPDSIWIRPAHRLH